MIESPARQNGEPVGTTEEPRYQQRGPKPRPEDRHGHRKEQARHLSLRRIARLFTPYRWQLAIVTAIICIQADAIWVIQIFPEYTRPSNHGQCLGNGQASRETYTHFCPPASSWSRDWRTDRR